MDPIAELTMRIAELERRLDASVRHGKVTDVDAQKHLARIEIGEREGKPVKSPWVPYAQFAGAFKFHNPPSVGQQLTLFAPNGELRQAMLLPFTWSDQNQSPSNDKDEHIITFGDFRMEITKNRFLVKFKGSELELKDGHANVVGDKVHTVGVTHLGVEAKDADASNKLVVEGLLLADRKRVFANTMGEPDPTAAAMQAAIDAAGDGGGGE